MDSLHKSIVFIYVQHLLGIGHLRRISFLARSLADQGLDVHLVSGGMPVANLATNNMQLHQLPPVRATNALFNELVDENNRPIDQPWKEKRCKTLLGLFATITPDILITETFPFGRRMMRFELLPLLRQAKQRLNPPLILSSIRDILQPKQKQQRNQEIVDLIDSFYDRVLVHGDDSIARLEATFPHARKIENKVFYTGYIVDPKAPLDARPTSARKGVLVSGGGGAASLPLLQVAIKARPLSDLAQHTWRLLVGHNINQTEFENLQQHAHSKLIIERNRSDFLSLLKTCAVSVSQAGYNTVMDILKTETPAVLVPYSESGELEQTIRAGLLQQQGRVSCIEESLLCAETLASAIDQTAKKPINRMQYKMDGANKSAELIKGWIS